MRLRDFVDNELLPAMFLELDKVFPEMKFERVGNKWRSPFNIDGTTPKHRKKDKTIVTESCFSVVTENGEGGSKNIISLFQERNNLSDRGEAIKEIAKIVGLEHLIPQNWNAQELEEIEKAKDFLILSLNRQRKALFDETNRGAVVTLKYLTEKRGYTLEEIREMGLGYVSADEAKFLQANCRITMNWNVSDFPLSFPYFSGGKIMGFKCRYVTAEAQQKWGNDKYRNANIEGLKMNDNPFGIFPSHLAKRDKKKQVIVVEGELDALHATLVGVPNVIATSGNNIVPEQAEEIRKNGYKDVVVLLDSDAAGQKFTGDSIVNLENAGLNAFTATLPEGKDVDEYLKNHSLEELTEVIDKAVFGGLWLYNKELEAYNNAPQTETEFFKFLDKFIELTSSYREPYKRDILFAYLRSDFANANGIVDNIEKGIKESIEKRVKKAADGDETKTAVETFKEASATIIDDSQKEGKTETLEAVQDALKVIGKSEAKINAINTLRTLSPSVIREVGNGSRLDDIKKLRNAVETLKKAEQDDSFEKLLKDNTDELYESYKDVIEALQTNFELCHKVGQREDIYRLTFPSGALSVIGAQTNHGKSKILQSLTLDTIEKMKDNGETLLYITYEEGERNVNAQFENAYFDDTLTENTGKGSNMATIMDYHTKGDTRFMRSETKDKFFKKVEEWKAIRRSGKVRIVKPEDNYLDTLIGLIEYSAKRLKLRAIFLDYIQEVYVENWAKYSRTDELKQAMVQLDLMAQKYKLPIILAAQLSREAISPLDLTNQCIADSGWIEKKASEILLVWSNSEDVRGKSLKETDDKKTRVDKEIPELYKDGKDGKLYFKMTKSRIIPKGSFAIVEIDGNTGRVRGNKQKEEPKQQQLFVYQTHRVGGKPQPDDNAKIDPEAQMPYRKPDDDKPF